jgi:hypothetical protein
VNLVVLAQGVGSCGWYQYEFGGSADICGGMYSIPATLLCSDEFSSPQIGRVLEVVIYINIYHRPSLCSYFVVRLPLPGPG